MVLGYSLVPETTATLTVLITAAVCMPLRVTVWTDKVNSFLSCDEWPQSSRSSVSSSRTSVQWTIWCRVVVCVEADCRVWKQKEVRQKNLQHCIRRSCRINPSESHRSIHGSHKEEMNFIWINNEFVVEEIWCQSSKFTLAIIVVVIVVVPHFIPSIPDRDYPSSHSGSVSGAGVSDPRWRPSGTVTPCTSAKAASTSTSSSLTGHWKIWK